MRSVRVEDAIGLVLGHDITRIIRGKTKERAYKKGHIICSEDISPLLDLGKKHIYVLDLDSEYLHEDEAAQAIAKAAVGPDILLTEPKEGKIELSAGIFGLLKINVSLLEKLNSIDQIMFATIHSGQMVKQRKVIAGTRIIPLVIKQESITEAVRLLKSSGPMIQVKKLKRSKVGIVTTGSEVYEKRIKDQFGPVLRKKFSMLGCDVLEQVIVPDDADLISQSINNLICSGADFIATSGGMSVDPDDVTPSGIRGAGGRIITYGAPVLPGAMFMLAYKEDIPIVGLPGCVMYHDTTVFELIVPRLLAGEKISQKDFAKLGHGGLCASCEVCRYPDCGFGK